MKITKAILGAALCFSVAGSPVLAQSAAPLSVAAPVDRSGAATEDESSLDTSGYLLPALVIIVVLAGAILLASGGSDNPSSP
ncbi:MAG TPA: hypothetical protein VIT38_08485 [Allosphingosinicella sp.]